MQTSESALPVPQVVESLVLYMDEERSMKADALTEVEKGVTEHLIDSLISNRFLSDYSAALETRRVQSSLLRTDLEMNAADNFSLVKCMRHSF